MAMVEPGQSVLLVLLSLGAFGVIMGGSLAWFMVWILTPDCDALLRRIADAIRKPDGWVPPTDAELNHDVMMFCACLMAVILAPVSLATLAMTGDNPMDVVASLLLAYLAGFITHWLMVRERPRKIDPELARADGGRERDRHIDNLAGRN